MDNSQKKIVILGAGFGGLRAAMLLAKTKHQVTLVDKNAYHTYTPILYEVAITSKDLANSCDLKSIATFPITELVKGLPINFINEEIKQIDVNRCEVHLASQNISFDYLILALGTEINYFNIPGLKEKSFGFKNFIDALKIRDEITSLPFLSTKPKVVIGGGGSTGVELAGEIQLSGLAKVTIVQAPPEILSGFNQKVVDKAKKRLDHLNVKIIYDWIVAIENKEVILKNSGKINFDVLVWTGGNKVSDLIKSLPLKKESDDRIKVSREMACSLLNPDLNSAGKIFAIGDVTCCHDQLTGVPLPGLASVALDQARVAVKNILDQKNIYRPKKFYYILPIGGKYAIAQLGNWIFDGFTAWILKGLVEFYYLSQVMPWKMALKIWVKGMKIFFENDRLG